MADDNIKKFTVSWILFGLLFFSLVSFAIVFIANNNPQGLADSSDIFDDTSSEISSRLVVLPTEGDVILNITSKSNPEISFLSSRDSVATAFKFFGNSKGFFQSSKIFFGWIFTGTTGKMLLGVFGGLFAFVGLYFIIKFFRTGT